MDERDRQLALEYFKAKDPNPGRVGCPEIAVLKQLAAGQLEASSEWYSHFRNCGACTAQAEQIRRHGRFRRLAVLSGALAAAVAIAVFLGANRTSSNTQARNPSPPTPPPSTSAPSNDTSPPKAEPAVPAKKLAQPSAIVIASLDYSRFAPTRGDLENKPPTPTAARKQGLVEIVLPTASAAGRYEVQIVDQQSLTVLARTPGGLATLRPLGVTVLALQCDLRSLAPGTYSVALRPANGQWSLFPIEIQ